MPRAVGPQPSRHLYAGTPGMMTSPAPPVALSVPVVMPPGIGSPRNFTFFGGFLVLLTLTTLGTGLSFGALILPPVEPRDAAATAAVRDITATARTRRMITRVDRFGGLTAASLSSVAVVRSGVSAVRYRLPGEPLKSETVYRYSPDNAFSALDEWTNAEMGERAAAA